MGGRGGVDGGREAQSAEGSGPAGQHRELHVTQLSMTTRERGRERGEGKSERWREREHGKAQLRSESAQLEQRVKNKAPSDFHFFPLCLLYIVHRRVPLFFTGNKGALKGRHKCRDTHGQTHTCMYTLVWLIELCLYSKSNGLFSL